MQAVGAAAPVAEVGVPQRAGEYHQLLLLAPTGVLGGGQLREDLVGRYWVIRRSRGSSEAPGGAANPNCALVWKTGPSASAGYVGGPVSGAATEHDCGIRPSTFYAYKKCPMPARVLGDAGSTALIVSIYQDNYSVACRGAAYRAVWVWGWRGCGVRLVC